MKNLSMPRILAALLAAALLGSCATAPSNPEPVAVRLIGINDFHGNLESANLNLALVDPADQHVLRVNTGGAAALAGAVKALRAGAPHSLMIGAGDLIGAAPLVSTLFRQEAAIEVLNAVGLEVSSLGNHEFDAGVAELKRLIAGGCAPNPPDNPATSCAHGPYGGARFEYLGANVLGADGKPIIAPHTVRRFDGVPLGIIGAVTKATPTLVVPSGVAGLRFIDEAEAVNRAARELRSQGVRAMVAVFHEGFDLGTPQKRGDWNDTTCPDAHGPLLGILRRLDPEIKVVFSGHTHQGYRCELDGRIVIQGTSFGRGVSVVDVKLDRASGRLLPEHTRSINLPVLNERTDPQHRSRLAASTPAPYAAVLREARPDEAIARQVARYAEAVAPKAARPVGTITATFNRVGTTDSAAGRLIADAQLAATKRDGAQIAFMNPGGVRSNLDCNSPPPCRVTFGQAFTMQPFGNSLVVMSMSGRELKALLESQQRTPEGPPLFLSPSEGFTYTWQSDAPRGERVRDMRLNGQPVDPNATYRFTVNSFLAEGGDGFPLLREGKERVGGMQDIDALIAYLQAAERAPSAAARIIRKP